MAIVGTSGSGKIAIINLIPRLYDVTKKRVLRRHRCAAARPCRPSKECRRGSETYLFNGTIRENLQYANPAATEEDMIAACKKANIYDFDIQAQELGLDTIKPRLKEPAARNSVFRLPGFY